MSALRDADARMFAASGEPGQALTSFVQPYFKLARIRDCSSWWASDRMDSLLLQEHVRRGEFNAELAARIANRMTGECKKPLKRLSERSEGLASERLHSSSLSSVAEVCRDVEAAAPTQPSVEVKRDGSISYE